MVYQIAIAIDQRKHQERNTQHYPVDWSHRTGSAVAGTGEVSENTNQEQNECAEDRAAEHYDALMQKSEVLVKKNPKMPPLKIGAQ